MEWTRRRIVLVAVPVTLLAGLSAWLLWRDPEPPAPPRERAYEAFTACLLTDDKGLAGERARAAWEGLQRISLERSIKVQYLAVEGPQTSGNAASYFNTLGLQGCQAVVAVGAVPVAALAEGKSRFPKAGYVTVDGDGGSMAGVTVVQGQTAGQVADAVATAVGRIRDAEPAKSSYTFRYLR